ncbi:MAG: pirin family protein [Bacteroidales bacterium]|jgi:redox-sensitive bicupin YhaK (pirin superfamily)|nr:pirin family protein [Bacteroidales bacterium]MCK9499585.1 pirin family protein [Bacteroidales bacterium]MDY0315538.1 pirin family protein [Bacteroidales bacterium]NLB86720.1 pirin family protein [Bacteroidales bacterium]
MKQKNIELILPPREAHWVGDGFRVHNFIPAYKSLSMKRLSPFILLDYNSKYNFPPSATPRGVGVHPHRGFETVTIAYKGKVEHHDSSGGGGIIADGDVQWMTAAAGVLHKEFHETEWSKKGGDFHMVQLWVNLPAKNKMNEAKYQAITNENMGKYYLLENDGLVEIIAGEYLGVKGPASTFTPINLFNAKLNKNAKTEFSFPKDYNTAILVIEGSIKLNSELVAENNFVLMANDGENFNIQALENAIVLIMSGKPIDEPISAYGPFVMNTEEEIVKAFDDFNSGKFGHLE